MSCGGRFAVAFALVCAAFSCLADDVLRLQSAPNRVPVVELYTSEGCSSCPPADAWMRRLRQALDAPAEAQPEFALQAVPLAFHVDYWNYLGWPDPFSKPAFTRRQREAPANRSGRIYTPEFIADGREARAGADILHAIGRANSEAAEVDIAVEVARIDDGITARLKVDNRADAAAQAHLAIYENEITRQIGGGENRGRTIDYDCVVRHFSRAVALRPGENETSFRLAIPSDWKRENLGLAVVVIARDNGETLQAVRGALTGVL